MIFFQTLADLFYILYLSTDHPQFFANIGFIKHWSQQRRDFLGWLTELWWFLQTVCEILVHIVQIQDLHSQISQLKQRRRQVMNMMTTLFELNPQGQHNKARADTQAPSTA